jgi:riboflavin synthase
VFTGIVSGLGRVAQVSPGRLGIEHAATVGTVELGSSVAVNGVCLTVTSTEGEVFFADVVPETLSRTNLGHLRPDDEVNLERPLRLDQGLDGHLVQGHVDGVGRVEEVLDTALGKQVTIGLPASLARYVAEKGSIAVDGTSLTVAAIDPERPSFTVALIPHTLEHTIARTYRPGCTVNLEVDVLARYAERLLGVK